MTARPYLFKLGGKDATSSFDEFAQRNLTAFAAASDHSYRRISPKEAECDHRLGITSRKRHIKV